ncbi:hypothetical protein [Actinomadura litoris]|uniref:Uncharacterized protein n=1 Tax=Actinomadura litoris TaxID=2678616 RepID=A0A7K1LB69_9ACTN|nr:hypothetical protein [Actinomadura litoris]MUN41668.1 hypothetical protein [Actinomadura litoris]
MSTLPDRYRQLLRVLAALNITLVRAEPASDQVPRGEWPIASHPSLAVRELLEEALIADAYFTTGRTRPVELPYGTYIRHVYAASALIDAAAFATTPATAPSGSPLTDWIHQPMTDTPDGNRDRARHLLRTVAAGHRAEHARSQQPGLTGPERRLAAAHLEGQRQALDALAAALAHMPDMPATDVDLLDPPPDAAPSTPDPADPAQPDAAQPRRVVRSIVSGWEPLT